MFSDLVQLLWSIAEAHEATKDTATDDAAQQMGPEFLKLIASASPGVQITFIIALVIIIAMLTKTPIYNYLMKKFGKKYHLIDESSEKGDDTKTPTHDYRNDVALAVKAIQELSDQMSKLTNVVSNLQIAIVGNEDRTSEIMTHVITTLTDLTVEYRKNRLFPNDESKK